jgi:GH15 family glucan-1,4-alpha-glucosidase
VDDHEVTLKLLTHGPSGGIVAAATAGLPEAVPGNRNYDYRYVWMRDASFTVTAFVNLGYQRELGSYRPRAGSAGTRRLRAGSRD